MVTSTRAIKCMFLGYVFESKGYRIWGVLIPKVIDNTDVTFTENAVFSLEKEHVNSSTCTMFDQKMIHVISFYYLI